MPNLNAIPNLSVVDVKMVITGGFHAIYKQLQIFIQRRKRRHHMIVYDHVMPSIAQFFI